MSGGHNKFTYEKVSNIFSVHGFTLLESKYISNNTPMRAICPCGEEVCIRLSHVQKGNRCQRCRAKSNSEKFRKSNAELSAFCKKHGCKFLRSWIKDKRTRIAYVCKCGQECEAYWTNFKKFPNCWECGKAKKSGSNCYM